MAWVYEVRHSSPTHPLTHSPTSTSTSTSTRRKKGGSRPSKCWPIQRTKNWQTCFATYKTTSTARPQLFSEIRRPSILRTPCHEHEATQPNATPLPRALKVQQPPNKPKRPKRPKGITPPYAAPLFATGIRRHGRQSGFTSTLARHSLTSPRFSTSTS